MSASTVAPDVTFLLVPEVAARLRESEWTVRTFIRRGDLVAYRFGPGKRAPYRVAESDLQAFLDSRRIA